MKTEEGLWTVHDVASHLKVSVSWVYKAAEGGTIPCTRFGGFLRFEPAAVKAWAVKGKAA